MLSWPIIGRLGFLSRIFLRFVNPSSSLLYSDSLVSRFTEGNVGDKFIEERPSSSRFILEILGRPSFPQFFLIYSKKFLAKRLVPVAFKCSPFLLKCLLLMLLLSTTSISNSNRCLLS